MAKRTWILLDAEEDQYVDEIRLTSADAGGVAEGVTITKRRLRGGRRDGVDVVEVDNGAFRFTVIPTRGMGLWRAALGQVHLGWQSPVHGPVHPGLVNLQQSDGLGWLTGFDELLARCGLWNNGSPVFNENGTLRWGLHGRIQNTPADKVHVEIDDASGEISVFGVVEEGFLYHHKLRLTTTYQTLPGEPGVRIVDTVTNVSDKPSQMQLLYHVNLGLPLVDAGSKLVAPVAKVAPRAEGEYDKIESWNTYLPESPDADGSCFFTTLLAGVDGWTRTLLHNADGTRGMTLKYNTAQLPCFTQWKNAQPAVDGYVTGLEPATNYPNERTFEESKGRVVAMGPGETRTFELALEAHADASSVAAAKAEVAKLQGSHKPEVLTKPNPEWSAV